MQETLDQINATLERLHVPSFPGQMPGNIYQPHQPYQFYQPYQPQQEQPRSSYAQATAEHQALPLLVPGPGEPEPSTSAPRLGPQPMEMDVGGTRALRGRRSLPH
jgi:hypothetical protein